MTKNDGETTAELKCWVNMVLNLMACESSASAQDTDGRGGFAIPTGTFVPMP